jgi:ankyrin repeat protein
LINELQLLLERGANLEATDEDGAIPLHDACAGGSLNYHILIVELFKFIC